VYDRQKISESWRNTRSISTSNWHQQHHNIPFARL